MKIKADFVTNSSSACYIVMIPPEFKLQDHLSMLEKGGIFNQFQLYTEGGDREIELEKVEAFFELLLDQGSVIEDWFEDSRMYMWIVLDICRDLKFEVTQYDIPHEGRNQIINVGVPAILDVVKEIGGLVEDKTRLRDK